MYYKYFPVPLIVCVCVCVSPQTKVGQSNNEEVEVVRCSRGQYFGELALVTNKPRAASVYAVGQTKCLGMAVWFLLITTYCFLVLILILSCECRVV